jgi:hypothetical protein
MLPPTRPPVPSAGRRHTRGTRGSSARHWPRSREMSAAGLAAGRTTSCRIRSRLRAAACAAGRLAHACRIPGRRGGYCRRRNRRASQSSTALPRSPHADWAPRRVSVSAGAPGPPARAPRRAHSTRAARSGYQPRTVKTRRKLLRDRPPAPNQRTRTVSPGTSWKFCSRFCRRRMLW